MRRQLLEFKSALACRQTDIGLVPEYPFSIKLKEHVRIMPKATSLPPDERKWVKEYIAGMVETGVMELVPTAQCACNIVLVKEGQSGQIFCLYSNYIELNAFTVEEKYPIPDQATIRD